MPHAVAFGNIHQKKRDNHHGTALQQRMKIIIVSA
jgi:hypothetical protein